MTRRTSRSTNVDPKIDEIVEEHGDWYRAQKGETFIVTLITESYEAWYKIRNGVREVYAEDYYVILGGPTLTKNGNAHAVQWSEQRYSDGVKGRRLERLPEAAKDYTVGKDVISQ